MSKIPRVSLVLFLVSLFNPSRSVAHPLDEFYQVTFITVGANRAEFTIELYPGVLVAPQLLALLDVDDDDQISEEEAQAYAEKFVNDLVLEVDGTAVDPTVDRMEIPPSLEIRAG